MAYLHRSTIRNLSGHIVVSQLKEGELVLNAIYRFGPGRLYDHLNPSFSRFAPKYPPASILSFFGF